MKEATQIARELRMIMAREKWTQKQLASYAGVDQSQVSRMLNARFVRISKNVEAVCKYAKIGTSSAVRSAKLSAKLESAMSELIGGDLNREKALLALIRAGERLLRTGTAAKGK